MLVISDRKIDRMFNRSSNQIKKRIKDEYLVYIFIFKYYGVTVVTLHPFTEENAK